MDTNLIECNVCHGQFEARYSFGVYMRGDMYAYDPKKYWLCKEHGIMEHQKRTFSVYYFPPYVRRKANKYERRLHDQHPETDPVYLFVKTLNAYEKLRDAVQEFMLSHLVDRKTFPTVAEVEREYPKFAAALKEIAEVENVRPVPINEINHER